MKRSVHFRMAALATAFMFLAACSDDPVEEKPVPKPTDPNPQVALTAGEPTEHSVSFTLTPSEADKCVFRLLESDAAAPDADALFASGEEVAADKPTPKTVSDLMPDTKYVVYAVASKDEFVGSVTQLELTTSKHIEPPVRTIELEWPLLAYYYSERELENTGNFYFNLVRGQVDDHEFPVAGSDNYVFLADLYSTLPVDLEHPVLPEGTYTFSDVQKVRGTFFVSSDMTGPTFYEIENLQSVGFTDGTIEISHTDKGYRMVGDFVTTAGEPIRFTYEGEIPFENKDIAKNVDVTCTQASAVWKGDLYEKGNSTWSVRMSDVAIGENGFPVEAGTVIDLVLFGDPFDTFDEADLTQGDYTVDNTFAIKTLMRGGMDQQSAKTGSYATLWNGSRGEYLDLYEGTLGIRKSGDTYTLTLAARTDDQIEVKATYTGAIPFTSEVDEPDPEPGISTLTHDVTISPADILWHDLYDYGSMYDGSTQFEISFENDDFKLTIPVNATAGIEGYVPTGTYRLMPDTEIASYVPFTAEPGYIFDDYSCGTYYMSYLTNEVGYVKSGTLEVAYDADTEEYIFTWDFRDDSPKKHRITGSYSGPMDLY